MDELLDMVFEQPDEARRRANEILSSDPDDVARSYAHQALAIVLREQGLADEALAEARAALRAAERAGAADRATDVRATYGGTLVLAGRVRTGLAQLARALEGASGAIRAKVLMRTAGALAYLARYDDAAPMAREALGTMAEEDSAIWVARTRLWLGHIELRRGNVDAAATEIAAAEAGLRTVGAEIEGLTAVAAVAEVAVARGDLVRGLRLFRTAVAGYQDRGQPVWLDTLAGYAGAYLAAGLAGEAAALLHEAAGHLALPPVERAELDLMVATAALAAGDLRSAREAARRAGTAFRREGRAWFARRAAFVEIKARLGEGDRRGVRDRLGAVAAELDAEHAHEAPEALTLAGRLASRDQRSELWTRAASYRDHPHGLVRAAAWLALGLTREDVGDRSGVLRAAASGLDAIDEHRRLLGSSELRALATTHGRELTAIALRHAAHDPRTLLRWSERTRATALAQPPATSDATTIPASLAALRDNGRRLAEARQAGEPTEQLEKERLRLERAVRAEHHTLAPGTEEAQRPATAEEVVAGVGGGCLVELVDVDGVLHVLVVHAGRVRRRVAGTTAEVAELLGPAAMLMRRASRGRATSTADLGQRLQDAILGDAVRALPDGPVVLAPTARLHGLPWALLPELADRPFSVVPSAGQWLRARSVRRPRARRTALVTGPGLATGGAEVPVLAERYPDALVLDGEDATVDATLRALDGADLVHLAAHGRFRADSPLFSALELGDGPLVVHDLERLKRAPHRVVLSACESGVLAPVGAEELLGLAAALISLGTSGLVCSVADVNDEATARLMVRLHEELAAGANPATALLATRRSMADEPVAAATAAAFVALGA